METLLIIALILVTFGSIGVAPTWGYSSGWGPSGFFLALLLILIVVFFLGPTRAHASDGISPLAWKCARLYKARNDFYNSRGLCFTRDMAKGFYPENELTCTIKHGRDFPISAREKQAVDVIVAKERSLGCPRL